jgi:hypothetical protein
MLVSKNIIPLWILVIVLLNILRCAIFNFL